MGPKKEATKLDLPASVVSRVDATHLARELESIDDLLEQQRHLERQTTAARPSQLLAEIAETNQLDLAQAADRSQLQQFLKEVKTKAPIIHMSFATDPSSVFSAKLVSWLRAEIHPLVLLDIGLQPSIGAGCIIRTTNKYFDCSVRQHLVQNKPKLVSLLQGAQHA